MSASHRVVATVFHAIFACGITALSIALGLEGRQRAAYSAALAFACAGAALGLGLVNARALWWIYFYWERSSLRPFVPSPSTGSG